ncbi:hypothetical protein [Streptomyces adustus]
MSDPVKVTVVAPRQHYNFSDLEEWWGTIGLQHWANRRNSLTY